VTGAAVEQVQPPKAAPSEGLGRRLTRGSLPAVFHVKFRTQVNFLHFSPSSFASRVAGTVAGKLVKPAVVATQHDTAAHFASIRTGRSTITSVDRPSKPSSKERHQQ